MSRDRERFVLCRGLLRHLLGGYLSIPPDGFELSYGTWGKPTLAPDRGHGTLSFNTSHSGNKVVYAITPHRPVGIDIERCDAAVDHLDIMRLFFSPDETASLMALEQEAQREAFFSLWTCKEAYVKAVGKGLRLPLNRVRISFSRPGTPVLVETEENHEKYGPWSLVSLSPYAGFKAALAFPGRRVRLEYRDTPFIL
jgi:4'-phosphopantetheinyl transferase